MQLSMEAIAEKAQMKLECVKEYDQKRNILQKQLICQYWLRGTCCFPDYFCHFAHGCKDLSYSIKSISECQEPYSENLGEVIKFKSPRIYFVLLQQQFNPFIREQLKEYFEQIGEPFDENTVFTNEDLKTQRKVKQIILTYTILQDIILFYDLILTSLNTNKIPKALFAHELDRTGYSLMGSQKARPYTLIYHLQSYGICYQKNLVPDFQFKPYVGNRKVQQFANDEPIQQKENDQEGEDNENEDEDEEQEVVTQLDDGRLSFLIKVNNLEELKVEFIKQLRIILEAHPELKLLQDFDDFQERLFELMQPFQHLPTLYQLLRLLNTVWGKFIQEYGFEEYQFNNSIESGISIPMIVQTFTQEQKDCLNEYLQRPKHKYFFCQYWLRGICIFQRKDCRFAHGLEDLELQLEAQLDIKNLMEQQKPLRFNQKPLINHRTYRILYMYQFNMNCKLRDQFIIDNLKEYRDRIREQMLREIIITLFAKINKGVPLQKRVVLKFFENVGLYQKGGIDVNDKKLLKILTAEQLAIEREVLIEQEIVPEQQEQQVSKKDRKKAQKKDTYLVPQREYPYYLEKYTKFIFDIILMELNKGTELPIQENNIKKHINQLDQDINLPGLYVFLRMLPKNTQTLQEFIQKSIMPVSKVYLKDKLKAEIYDLIMENGSNLVDFEMDMAKIAISIQNVYEAQRQLKYLLNFEKMMKLIEIDLQEQLSQMKKDRIKSELYQFMMLQKNHNLISINGCHYFINDLQQMDQQFQMDKLCHCHKSSKFPSIVQKQPEEKLLQLIEQAQAFVDKDVRNTIIVDDQVKLDVSQQILAQATIVAIDLEGQLKAGNIWLVQLGLTVRDKRLVIIFDLMKVRFLDQNIVLYTQMISYLESMLENEGICKVFHDCKRDSQALHKNGICPKNVADTSATYVFIKQLQLQAEFQNKYKQPRKIAQMLPGLIREIQQVQTPQINTVLKTYNAKYGANELKLAMKSNFKGEGEYDFFARPNPEFMFYSARDVEDLVQVYLEMESLIADRRIIMEKWSRKNRGFFIKK